MKNHKYMVKWEKGPSCFDPHETHGLGVEYVTAPNKQSAKEQVEDQVGRYYGGFYVTSVERVNKVEWQTQHQNLPRQLFGAAFQHAEKFDRSESERDLTSKIKEVNYGFWHIFTVKMT